MPKRHPSSMAPAVKSKATECEKRVTMASNRIPGSPAQASNTIKKEAGSASLKFPHFNTGDRPENCQNMLQQRDLMPKKYSKNMSSTNPKPPKIGLGDPPEQSRNTIQAKNRSESESFGLAPPCEDEKGSQNDLQIHQKSLPNSDMSCTLFSDTF